MFKRKDSKKGFSSKVDKLIMGAIIGGAIGSVVGASLSPREKGPTKNNESQKSKKPGLIKKFFGLLIRKKKDLMMKKIPHEGIEFTMEEQEHELRN